MQHPPHFFSSSSSFQDLYRHFNKLYPYILNFRRIFRVKMDHLFIQVFIQCGVRLGAIFLGRNLPLFVGTEVVANKNCQPPPPSFSSCLLSLVTSLQYARPFMILTLLLRMLRPILLLLLKPMDRDQLTVTSLWL